MYTPSTTLKIWLKELCNRADTTEITIIYILTLFQIISYFNFSTFAMRLHITYVKIHIKS